MGDECVKVTAKDARRQGIMSVAEEIFLEGGYATTSMSAIATRVGGSKGTLYNYFSSKEELFRAVIRDKCEHKIAVMYDGVKTNSTDVVAGLRVIGRRYAALVLADDTLGFNRMLIAEALRFPELGQIMYEAGPRGTVSRLAVYLKTHIDAGRLRLADPERAANQFLDLSVSGLYRQRLWNAIPSPTAETIQHNIDAAIATFMAAFGAQESVPA